MKHHIKLNAMEHNERAIKSNPIKSNQIKCINIQQNLIL